ncbi:DNA-directed RNA polymerase d subunit 2a-like protein, partial [Trifolium pratense]
VQVKFFRSLNFIIGRMQLWLSMYISDNNQEDSLVMNRASLQRGMFRSEHIRSYKAVIENKESSDKRKKPEDIINLGKIQSKIGRVDSLDEDGFPFLARICRVVILLLGGVLIQGQTTL